MSNTTLYKVSLLMQYKDVTTVLQALEGVATLFHMEAAPATSDKPKSKSRFANGQRMKGITGQRLALKLLFENRTMRPVDISEAFVKHGFAPHSSSSNLSDLRAGGFASVDVHGWHLTEKGKDHYRKLFEEPKVNGAVSAHDH